MEILLLMLVLAISQAFVKKPPGYLLKSHSGKTYLVLSSKGKNTGSQDELEEERKPEEELLEIKSDESESKEPTEKHTTDYRLPGSDVIDDKYNDNAGKGRSFNTSRVYHLISPIKD